MTNWTDLSSPTASFSAGATFDSASLWGGSLPGAQQLAAAQAALATDEQALLSDMAPLPAPSAPLGQVANLGDLSTLPTRPALPAAPPVAPTLPASILTGLAAR